MAARTVYYGRFISAPTPDELLIQTGAVLVSSRDGRGIIEKADWRVTGAEDALAKFGIEVPVVTSGEHGFFFPGFIGMFYVLPSWDTTAGFRLGSLYC